MPASAERRAHELTDLAIRLALSGLAAIVGRVPFRGLRLLGGLPAWIFGRVVRVRLTQVEAALARAKLASTHAQGMYRSLATGVMELLWLAGGRNKALERVVGIDAASELALASALGEGRGVVMAASHTGNWELAACAMARRAPLSVLVKKVSIGGFDRFMRRTRSRYGVELLLGEGALGRARGCVRAGRVVAVLADQVPPIVSQGTWVPFLGDRALTDRSAAALSAATGAPLLVTASRRTVDGTHVLHVLRVLRPPAEDRHAWTYEATRQSAAALDEFVRANPDQWLWLHRRWKEPPRSAARLVTAPPAH